MDFSYIAKYSLPPLHGYDDPTTPRPWDLTKEILAYSGTNTKLLDIGCGTASKIVPLAPFFNEITGLDISFDMINSAYLTIKNNQIENVKLINADSANLPFDDNSFDVITCMLSRWEIKEIVRVLKPNGIVIIEHIGCEDKKDFKTIFGKDHYGWRGQFIEYNSTEYLQFYTDLFREHFDSVSIKNGFWRTYYTEQGIIDLLKFTPSVRNFNQASDNCILKKAIDLFKNEQGIALTQNRILIHAKNIKNLPVSRY